MSTPKNGKRILTIDDDAVARDIYRAILEEDGFEVVCAGGGKEGIELFGQQRFDCVIIDIYMPGLTGLDVINQLDPETTKIPIIAISGGGGKTGAQPLQLAATLGAARSFPKDCEHEDLLMAVRELTGV